MSAPLGSPENPVTAFVGRHPRLCGAVLVIAGGAIVWWQAVRPILLAGEEESFALSPKLAALGCLLFLTGLAYVVAGPRLYRALVLEKTPERSRRLRWLGYALGALVAIFYFALIAWLESRGYTQGA